MKIHHFLVILSAVGTNVHLFSCEAPGAIHHYGQEQLTFESVLLQYARYKPQLSECRNSEKKPHLDTDLVHGIRTLDPDLVATTINTRQWRSCPVPLHPTGNYYNLQGFSAQIIAAAQLELVMRNQESKETIQTARDIVTIVSGGATEYMVQKWNSKRH